MTNQEKMEVNACLEELSTELVQILGSEHVILDEAERRFYSQDIYRQGALIALAIRPGSLKELSHAVAATTRAGFAIAPRGGGMSYTSGYIQAAPNAVMVDMARLNRITEINEEDMYVIVEGGCTWAALYQALKEKGLRTPCWGTLSGLRATVGGTLSQNGLFFGAGQYGPSAESVLGLKVVLADGVVITTGTWGTRGGSPFFRHYGPDLTGIFLGDAGALGFKAQVALRLIPIPAFEDSVSFAFDTYQDCADALCDIGRTGMASELFGFDPSLAEMRLKRESLAKDIGALKGVISGSSSLVKGVKEAAKVAVAGRRYMDEVAYSVNVVVEGRSAQGVAADLADVRRIALAYNGREIANSIPKIIRGTPFAPLNNMLGPEGQRWVPVHGIVPHTKAKSVWQAIYDLFDEYADAIEKYDITTGFLITAASTNAFLIEPVLLWPEQRLEIHNRSVEAHVLKRFTDFPANAPASKVVDEIKQRLCRLFLDFGAAHFQIGKTYLYAEGQDKTARSLLESIKNAVDPARKVNPGSLGLE